MSAFFESRDAAPNNSTTYSMDVGDFFYGYIEQNSTDWIGVNLQAGQTYTVAMTGVGALNLGSNDTYVAMASPDNFYIAFDNDSGPGGFSSVTFTAGMTGTYYIEAASLNFAFPGNYGVTITEGDRPALSAVMAAAVLHREDTSWSGSAGTGVTLTWAIRASGPATDAQNNPTAFQNVTNAQAAAAAAAIAAYDAICGIDFVRVAPGGVSNNATILFGGYTSSTDAAGAYALFPGPNATAGDVWLNNFSISGTDLQEGTYSYFLMLHELGHAMGLAHPGDYNATPGQSLTYENDAQYVEDSHQFTVMSYFDESETAGDFLSYPDTLLLHDVFALHQLYGANTAANAGNSIYGFNSNVGGVYDFTRNDDPFLCIWDGAGNDTLDLSGFAGRQRIDLTSGAFSDVGGFVGNLSIAFNAVIENAVGGRGSDQITGNAAANRLTGLGGVDTVRGADGNDSLFGGDARDLLFGDKGNDQLRGGAGDDALQGGAGNDTLNGDSGADTFVFLRGFGEDRIIGFADNVDTLRLDAAIWGGGRTIAQLINQFGTDLGADIRLDFGRDTITFTGLGTLSALQNDIVLF